MNIVMMGIIYGMMDVMIVILNVKNNVLTVDLKVVLVALWDGN